jgi:uncharacterized protein (TIGR00369 family)
MVLDEETRRLLDRISASFVVDIPHIRALNMAVQRIDADGVTMVMPYSRHLVGDPESGRLHGGAVTTLVDSVCGLSVLAAMPEPGPVATLDLRIDYLRPARPGLPLRAHASCFRLTRQIAFVRATAYHEEMSNPIAAAQASFIIKAQTGGLQADKGSG